MCTGKRFKSECYRSQRGRPQTPFLSDEDTKLQNRTAMSHCYKVTG